MNVLKGAVIFLLGAGVGATGSYVYFKKKYDERKEELDELKEHYQAKINKEIDLKTVDKIIEKQGYVSYDKKVVEKEDTNMIVNAIHDAPPEDYPEEPIVINETDYSEGELSFDKREFDYYIEDHALVDENEELMEVGDYIGYENLENFIDDNSEDVMYIRNASNGEDYMIRKVFGSFSEMVGVGGDNDD